MKKLLQDFDMDEDCNDQSLFHFTEYVFAMLEMESFDQTKNKDLWNQFREMLKGHPAFKNEWYCKHFQNHSKRKKYYWWRDPENWK